MEVGNVGDLVKIRDVSVQYGISARALKYYEEMGLISSTRCDDYAYRLYDDAALQRLEQILILRKLNISIKDIQRIFNTSGSELVLEVLGKKIDAIDEEVALLHELKEIVLNFIHQFKYADFGKDSDVKLLYEKAKEIETKIVNVDYDGNAANVNRLLEVTKKLAVSPEIVQKNSYCYLIFNLGSVDNVLGAVEMYGRAFGAEILSEDRGSFESNSWMGVNIRLFNFTIFMQSTANPLGGYCAVKFTSQNELQRAYDVIKEEAMESSLFTDWHWTPLSALVTDKFGVNWLFCI